MRRYLALLPALSLALGALLALRATALSRPEADAVVRGVVVDEAGAPVVGAVVRQQATALTTTSDAGGAFTLPGLQPGAVVTVTAWAEGCYPGGAIVVPPAAEVTLTLRAHPVGDHPETPWYTSLPDPDAALGCGHCMVAYPQWVANAHGTSGTNPRFLSLYNGTDVTGTETISPGYRTDFPGTAGNCANCHAPGAAVDAPFTTDMTALTGVAREGVFCDFCHKVAAVYLNPATGLPFANAPGVQSMAITRPPSDTHLFYGPFDDILRRVSYLDLEKQSEFCAPCHQFSFWGTPIYESFAEWRASPYAAAGITCQRCHMAPTGVDHFVYPAQGGLIRDPALIASHLQPGAADVALLQATVEMTLTARSGPDGIAVTVVLTNTGAGHHVPTDFPGRHMMLIVAAVDAQGQALEQVAGPVVPAWGGAQAGRPGRGFAKVLRDAVTGVYPVVSYWKPTLIVTDTRLAALASDRSTYTFAAPAADGPVTVTAEVRFRRSFAADQDRRGWGMPDTVMETATVTVTRNARYLLLPLVVRRK